MTTILQLLIVVAVDCWAVFLGWKSIRHFVREALRAQKTGSVTNSVSDPVTKQDASTIYWQTLLGLWLMAVLCAGVSIATVLSVTRFGLRLFSN